MFDSLKVKKEKKLINQSMQKMKTGENKASPPHIPVKGQKCAFSSGSAFFSFASCMLWLINYSKKKESRSENLSELIFSSNQLN